VKTQRKVVVVLLRNSVRNVF